MVNRFLVSVALVSVATPTLANDLDTDARLAELAALSADDHDKARRRGDIIVTGIRDEADSDVGLGALGNRTINDTPLSIASYDRELLDTIQARSLSAIGRFDPAVTQQVSSGGFGAGVGVRGFSADTVFDGLLTQATDLRAFNTPLFAIERVTLLRGVSSLVYAGNASAPLGGVVNLEPKRPLDTPLTRATAGFADRALGLVAVDVSRRFAGERVGVRLNLGTERGHGPIGLQDEIDNTVAALAFDLRVTPILTLSGGAQYSRAAVNAYRDDVGVAAGIPVPLAPPTRRNVTQPWGAYPAKSTLGFAEVRWEPLPDWSLRVRGLAGSTSRRFVSLFTEVVGADGAALSFPFALGFKAFDETVAASLAGRFSTGAIEHRVTFDATTYRNRGFLRTNFADGGVSNNGIPITEIETNLYRPVYIARPDRLDTSVGPLAVRDRSDGITGSWSATLGPVTLLGAARRVWLKGQSFYDGVNNTTLTDSYDESKTTPLAALTIVPTRALSIYASYAQGLELGTVAPPTTVNANQRLPVRATRQIEAGIKWEPRPDLLLTFAAFDMAQPQEFIDTINGQRVFVQSGRQRHRGLEFAINGRVTPSTRIVGGALLIDPVQLRTGNPSQDGKRALGVPTHRLTALVTQDITAVPGLSLTVAGEHVSKMFIDVLEDRSIPAWTRFDAGASYATKLGGRPTRLTLFMDNVLGERYWGGVSFGSLTYGVPEQTWRLSISTDF